MAQSKLSKGIQMIIARHAAKEGVKLGQKALAVLGKMSNTDPSEAIFEVGDQFTIPAADYIAEAVFVEQFNGNSVPAIAVECTNGQPKVLYISSMKKSVVEYEETADGYVPKKSADGTTVTHYSNSPIRKEIMDKATIADVVNALAGRTFKVTEVLGPIPTSRLNRKMDAYGNVTYEVVGLRNTTIPVFTEVK